jgi:hypothetical protein
MKHAGSIALRNVSLGCETSARAAMRSGLFKRIIIALHRSRRREASHLVRHYRHLIARDCRGRLTSAFPDFNNEHESSRNANADQTFVCSKHRSPYDV